MREIVLDIETTGLDPLQDRIIEIGCLELFDKIPTGEIFHVYLNPQQILSADNIKIHGITNEFLQDKESFPRIVYNLLDFIGTDPIVAHNATFDISFINQELERMFFPPLKNQVIDTLFMARNFFTTNNSLDGLCRRYNINIEHRSQHGALKDAELLSKVYYFLSHEDASNNDLYSTLIQEYQETQDNFLFQNRPAIFLTEEEKQHHEQMMCKLGADQ